MGMKKLRILIVEDDVVARIALENVLTDIASVAVMAKRSVAGANEVLGERFDIAFLDVNVADGDTFGLASALTARGVPLVFMGDKSSINLPTAWRGSALISKPPRAAAVRQVLAQAEQVQLVA
jgi:DNA-binding response OmpR family regulator